MEPSLGESKQALMTEATAQPSLRREETEALDVPLLHSLESTLAALVTHSKGHRMASRARRLFLQDAKISMLVGCWSVLLSAPVIIWPVADFLWDVGCVGQDQASCAEEAYCQWMGNACRTQRRSYLSMWGTMLIQLIVSVSRDCGSTVKFSVQGAFGTFLAWLNITLLHRVMGSWLRGGEARNLYGKQNSALLPLCNNGFEDLVHAGTPHHCFMNIWLDELTKAGFTKFIFLWFDLVLFIVLLLRIGFDANTRMFGLSTHVYFMMSFINPASADFDDVMTTPDTYMIMVLVAAAAAVLSFVLPERRFQAAEAAEGLVHEAAEAIGLLLESLHSTPAELMRQKARSALAETEVILEDLESTLESAWFEHTSRSTAAVRRKLRLRHAGAMRQCLQHVPAVHHTAEALEANEAIELEELLPSLGCLCAAARDQLFGLVSTDGTTASEGSVLRRQATLKAAQEHVAREFAVARTTLSGRSCAFTLAISGVASDVAVAVAAARCNSNTTESESLRPGGFWCSWSSALSGLRSAGRHFGMRWRDFEATHPCFVLRNTLSICLGFWIGWIGIWNVLPSYTSSVASVTCLIFFTYSGSSVPVTSARVAGVVIGTVIGTAIQFGLAVKHVGKACLFTVSMWTTVSGIFFLYLNSDALFGYTCCITAAFAASSMIPRDCRLREWADVTYYDEVPKIVARVISTVLGIALLTIIDFLFSSSAAKQARQRLLRAFRRAERLMACILSLRGERRTARAQRQQLLLEDLDALRGLLPLAAAEPRYCRSPFKVELYCVLERLLRSLALHAEALAWVRGVGPSQAPSQNPEVSTISEAAVDLTPLVLQLQSEVAPLVASALQLAAAVTDETADQAAARQVRKDLLDTLYTTRAVRYLLTPRAQAPRRFGAAVARSMASSFGHLCGQVAGDELPRDSLSSTEVSLCFQTTQGNSTGEPLTEAVQQLLEEAGHHRATSPVSDGVCRVELASLFANSIMKDLHQMQLALLEY